MTDKSSDTASQSLIKLSTVLAEVTKSLKMHNDALELHLKQSGWTIRRMEPQKAEPKTSNRP